MASGPVEHPSEEQLLAELDEMARRCVSAEKRAEAAEKRAAELDAEVARLRAEAESRPAHDDMVFFEGEPTSPADDEGDARVVSLALGSTAVVSAMVTLLALLNGNLFTTFGYVMIALTIGLAIAATRSRSQPVDVHITNGVVYAERGGSSYRFDLKNDSTRVEMDGSPGDSYWQVRFLRRNMDPLVVDDDMVDPASFVAQLRQYRPAL
ncbi:hypothetical protein HNR19_003604 [Nocardioides thalensis]|uniref:Uncharacterized protein n=1 Tax=Nocardioides thalensis TaxID=1914755 RepID=A0A853C7B7_9ACTN|nr:hypothetical protein [Nocardioides thalensis]NYJ02906.1 hypothetical protein [Nocardioides thalensis]